MEEAAAFEVLADAAPGTHPEPCADWSLVFCNADLLRMIRIFMQLRSELNRKPSAVFLRQLSRDVRHAYDQQLERLWLSDLHGDEAILPYDAFRAVRAVLLRGCQPRSLSLTLHKGPEAVRQQAALQTLSAFTAVASTLGTAMPTTSLHIDNALLDPIVAQAVPEALPHLQELGVYFGDLAAYGSSDESHLGGLIRLLSGAGDNEAPAGGGPRQLLELHSLWLSGFLSELPPGLTTAMRSCSQLQELSLGEYCLGAEAVAALASLTQLTSLQLRVHDETRALPVLLPQLTRLTRLELKKDADSYCVPDDEPRLAASAFTGLVGLRHLVVEHARLELRALQALTALSSLEVGSLYVSSAASEEEAGTDSSAAGSGCGRGEGLPCLPPGLHTLRLCLSHHDPELFVALSREQQPANLVVSGASDGQTLTLMLRRGRHSTGEGLLKPAAEEALCGVICYLGERVRPQRLEVDFMVGYGDEQPLLPVSSGPGPASELGRPCSHSKWLEALGSLLGLQRLSLRNIVLNEQDMQTVAEHLTSLKVLWLSGCSVYPLEALPLLARLPRLEMVVLHVDEYCDTKRDTAPLAAKRSALAAALAAAYTAGRYTGRVLLLHVKMDSDESQRCSFPMPHAALRAMLAQLRELMGAAGIDGKAVKFQYGNLPFT